MRCCGANYTRVGRYHPLMGLAHARRNLTERVEDVGRETGALMMVFAPLDYFLASERVTTGRAVLILFGLGALFLCVALTSEFRRIRAN